MFFEIHVEPSEGHHQLFVTGGFVVFGGFDAVIILMLNYLLDKLDSWVPFADVFLSLSGNHHLLQCLSSVDEKVPMPLAFGYDHGVSLVERVSNHQRVGFGEGQLIVAFCIRVGTHSRVQPL